MAGPPSDEPLTWTRQFPQFTDDLGAWQLERTADATSDLRTGAVYDTDPELELAVEVAAVTGRPLLLRGEPGSGKSSLAAYIARNLKRRYYEHVVTSATRAEDFLWTFDAVRRLGDAQARRAEDPAPDIYSYVEPGPLWWALNPRSAARRGVPPDHDRDVEAATEPFVDTNRDRREGQSVVLIDELDKADPDVANGLLVPLGSRRFTVSETGTQVDARHYDPPEPVIGDVSRVQVVITTNEERQLPPALIRRCIVHTIPEPTLTKLNRIALLHVEGPGATASEHDALFGEVAHALLETRDALRGEERRPGIAEYLDAVRTCIRLRTTPSTDAALWEQIKTVALHKPPPDHL